MDRKGPVLPNAQGMAGPYKQDGLLSRNVNDAAATDSSCIAVEHDSRYGCPLHWDKVKIDIRLRPPHQFQRHCLGRPRRVGVKDAAVVEDDRSLWRNRFLDRSAHNVFAGGQIKDAVLALIVTYC